MAGDSSSDGKVNSPGFSKTLPTKDRSARVLGIICLIITASGWALGWSTSKILFQRWPPLFARGTSGSLAAIGLALVAIHRRESLIVRRQAIPRLVLAAFTNVFAWQGFSAICLRWLPVGEGVLLVFTMPIWVALLAWPIRGIRPTARDLAALSLGLAGITILFGGHQFLLSTGQITGSAFALAAATMFALGTVLNGAPLPIAPVASTAWQLGLGCVPMLVLGLLFEHPVINALDFEGALALAYGCLVGMSICYLTWFAALRRLPASAAATGLLLVPLLGVVLASWILGESLGATEILAVALTLGGVALALQRSRRPSENLTETGSGGT